LRPGTPALAQFLYDLGYTTGEFGKNMLPIGQLLWEKELESYKEFPPLQAPETYNLTGILDAMKKAGHPSD
jgi:arylsulfatase A-like enzyme